MNKKQKQQAILGGSITLSMVLGLGAGVGIGAAVWKSANANGGVQQITFFSNQDYYLDKGFNEGTYNGVSKYGQNIDQSIGIQTSDAYYDFGQGDQYAEALIKIFDTAEYVVTAGGNVSEVVPGAMWYPESDADDADLINDVTDAQKNFQEHVIGYDDPNDEKVKSMILLDDISGVLAKTENENFVSVSYASEDAGFAAGIAASVYSASIYLEEGKDNKNTVGMWGGVNAPTIAFLSGFEQGVNYFNYAAYGVTPNTATETTKDTVKITPDGKQVINYGGAASDISTNEKLGDAEIGSWYSGSFELDTTKGAGKIAQLKAISMVDAGVNVIFPVAGGQTIIALDQINEGDSTKIIGVDTPAEDTQSGTNAEKILGSAVKELSESAELSLWYEMDFKIAFDEQYNSENKKVDIDDLSVEDVQYFVETYMSSSPYKNDIGAYKFAAADTLDADHISLETIDLGNSTLADNPTAGGWNTTQEVTVDGGSGTSFYGTYENGGIGFTTNKNYLDDAYAVIKNENSDAFAFEDGSFAQPTFKAFLEFALSEQGEEGKSGILASSITFGGTGTGDDLVTHEWDVVYKK